ncbi:MAG: M48 family metallopeptidase [Armatimonadetes bacterium]|nr:M48 family metallopeptidase [Armatimonadota bacterium]
MERKTLANISHEAFMAETDRKALEALKRVPLLPKVIKLFYEHGLDRWLYCYNMATSVRCGPKQFGTLDGILDECAAVLDMPKPELYVTSNPFPNAHTGGVERPYITVRSAIVDTLSDDQFYHLMGHELGHIKCGHVLYKTVAVVLMPLMELLAQRTLGLGTPAQIALLIAFYEWSRQAELSADRAGLLCSQEFELSASANLALTHGPSRLTGEASTEAFMDQARAYQDMSATDAIGKLLIFYFVGMQATHPMPVHRMQQLDKWYQEGHYDRIMKGQYPHEETRAS